MIEAHTQWPYDLYLNSSNLTSIATLTGAVKRLMLLNLLQSATLN
jgi:hypothetical protein